ncbi:hypothetical protein RHMOL_Rhmol04G0143600 [Rhododendron molle]|uniref:Uncharacterized protein n=2 Tax=Rhododendron molle TaxID=49168 RepID=A0ACC0P249_RHOML|nr:hypothetical protein RHMOL_Rhmol12G0089400 [Rhododendron molle]KAI8559037.1 hypothetical protein RHMOL_Rhmol04G0143600 [Rhododendron molle]
MRKAVWSLTKIWISMAVELMLSAVCSFSHATVRKAVWSLTAIGGNYNRSKIYTKAELDEEQIKLNNVSSSRKL